MRDGRREKKKREMYFLHSNNKEQKKTPSLILSQPGAGALSVTEEWIVLSPSANSSGFDLISPFLKAEGKNIIFKCMVEEHAHQGLKRKINKRLFNMYI